MKLFLRHRNAHAPTGPTTRPAITHLHPHGYWCSSRTRLRQAFHGRSTSERRHTKHYASVARALAGLRKRGLLFHTKHRAPLPELPEPPQLPEFYQSPFEHIEPTFLGAHWKSRIPEWHGPREAPKLPEPYAPLWEGHGGWYTRQEFEAQWVEWNMERQPSPRGVIRGAPAWERNNGLVTFATHYVKRALARFVPNRASASQKPTLATASKSSKWKPGAK
jgi:hypothetical protein